MEVAQRGLLSLEVILNDRVYVLQVPLGSPYKEAYEALGFFNQAIGSIEKTAQEAAAKGDSDVAECNISN